MIYCTFWKIYICFIVEIFFETGYTKIRTTKVTLDFSISYHETFDVYVCIYALENMHKNKELTSRLT